MPGMLLVLGDPEAPVAPILRLGCEIARVVERPTRIG